MGLEDPRPSSWGYLVGYQGYLQIQDVAVIFKQFLLNV